MVDSIEALMGLVAADDMAAQKALAHQLRGEQQAGEFYSLSPGVSRYGQTLQQNALDAAQTAGVRRNQGLARARQARIDEQTRRRNNRLDAFDVRKQEWVEGTPARAETALAAAQQREDDLLREAQEREDSVDARERQRTVADKALEFERDKILQGIKNQGAGGYLKESATERQNRVKAQTIAADAGYMLDNWTPGAVNPWIDVPAGFLNDTPLEGFKPIIEGMAYDEQQQQQRTRAAQLEGQISKLLAGLNLTGFELKERKRWSPFTEGISDEQSRTRLGILKDVFIRDANARRAAIGMPPLPPETPFTTLMSDASGAAYSSGGYDPNTPAGPVPVSPPITLNDGTVWQQMSDGTRQQVE